MRGGALPILVWGLLLSLLLAGNWVWTGDAIQVGQFGFALLAVLLSALALVAANRSAIRRGPPRSPAQARLKALPEISVGSALVPLAIASILFGFAFGHFLIYFGIGLLALAAGRLVIELRAQRRSVRRLRARPLAGSQRRREDGP
jgi:hypothetical protein